jgi:hypothetical protein
VIDAETKRYIDQKVVELRRFVKDQIKQSEKELKAYIDKQTGGTP